MREGQTEDKRNGQRTEQGHKDRQTEGQTTNQHNNQNPHQKTRKNWTGNFENKTPPPKKTFDFLTRYVIV